MSNPDARAETSVPFGPYRLTSLIGRGGMAEVWRALLVDDDGSAEAVAVKRILPHLCDELPVVEMFLSEARIAMRLIHPNLVRTLNAGLIKGQPYIAMELLDGADLVKLSHAAVELPVGFALSVVRDVCRALGYVHALRDDGGRALGLIHRDISPSNVMVQRDGTVKLLDFGIAKAALAGGMPRTDVGQLKGKLGYLAPEMIRHGRYDHGADLFAIGVVLWELLTHRRLFAANDDGMRLWLNAQCEVPPPSTWRPQLTPALDAVVLRALARDPAERHADAAALARDLEALLADEPWTTADTVALMRRRAPPSATKPSAAPPVAEGTTRPFVPRRARRRWPLAVAASATIALLGAAPLVWSLVAHREPVIVTASSSSPSPSPPSSQAQPRLTGAVVTVAGDAWARAGGLGAIASSDVTLTATAPPPPPPRVVVTVAQAVTLGPAKTPRHNLHHTTPSKPRQGPGDNELDKVLEQKGLIDVYSSGDHPRR